MKEQFDTLPPVERYIEEMGSHKAYDDLVRVSLLGAVDDSCIHAFPGIRIGIAAALTQGVNANACSADWVELLELAEL